MEDNKIARILVVDDDDSVRYSLACFLEDYDYRVTSSASAEQALTLLKQESFDVAIIDLRLPDIDGTQLIHEIHKDADNMRFLIHTGSREFKLTPALIAIGLQADHIFQKPLNDLQPMVDTLATLLDKERE